MSIRHKIDSSGHGILAEGEGIVPFASASRRLVNVEFKMTQNNPTRLFFVQAREPTQDSSCFIDELQQHPHQTRLVSARRSAVSLPSPSISIHWSRVNRVKSIKLAAWEVSWAVKAISWPF